MSSSDYKKDMMNAMNKARDFIMDSTVMMNAAEQAEFVKRFNLFPRRDSIWFTRPELTNCFNFATNTMPGEGLRHADQDGAMIRAIFEASNRRDFNKYIELTLRMLELEGFRPSRLNSVTGRLSFLFFRQDDPNPDSPVQCDYHFIGIRRMGRGNTVDDLVWAQKVPGKPPVVLGRLTDPDAIKKIILTTTASRYHFFGGAFDIL